MTVQFTLFVVYPLKVLQDFLAAPSVLLKEKNTKKLVPKLIVRPEDMSTEEHEDKPSTEENLELLPLVEEELVNVPLDAKHNSPSCTSCSALQSKNKKLGNQVKSLQNRLEEERKVLRKT